MPPAAADKIMHVRNPLGNRQALMASNIVPGFGHPLQLGNNVYVSLHSETIEEGESLLTALLEGGTVEAPFARAPRGDHGGAFKGRFGVSWMINVAGGPQ